MKKTSVYLTDDEAERLQRLAANSGRPQSEIIREGVRRVIGEGEPKRQFRSLGRGHGGGKPYSSWKATDVYKRAMGRR
jgi:ribbon-helix-helix CopG family protein